MFTINLPVFRSNFLLPALDLVCHRGRLRPSWGPLRRLRRSPHPHRRRERRPGQGGLRPGSFSMPRAPTDKMAPGWTNSAASLGDLLHLALATHTKIDGAWGPGKGCWLPPSQLLSWTPPLSGFSGKGPDPAAPTSAFGNFSAAGQARGPGIATRGSPATGFTVPCCAGEGTVSFFFRPPGIFSDTGPGVDVTHVAGLISKCCSAIPPVSSVASLLSSPNRKSFASFKFCPGFPPHL